MADLLYVRIVANIVRKGLNMDTVQDLINYLQEYAELELVIEAPCSTITFDEFTTEYCVIIKDKLYLGLY